MAMNPDKNRLQPSAARVADFSDLRWDTLIYDYVANGLVVSVVGPELLVADDDGTESPFYAVAVKRLAQASGLPVVSVETMDALFARARNWLERTDDLTRNALTKNLDGTAPSTQTLLTEPEIVASAGDMTRRTP